MPCYVPNCCVDRQPSTAHVTWHICDVHMNGGAAVHAAVYMYWTVDYCVCYVICDELGRQLS